MHIYLKKSKSFCKYEKKKISLSLLYFLCAFTQIICMFKKKNSERETLKYLLGLFVFKYLKSENLN